MTQTTDISTPADITARANALELSTAQVAEACGMDQQSLSLYMSRPSRWKKFFPHQSNPGPGRSRYYTANDYLVVRMLNDTTWQVDKAHESLPVLVRQEMAAEILSWDLTEVWGTDVYWYSDDTAEPKVEMRYRPDWYGLAALVAEAAPQAEK